MAELTEIANAGDQDPRISMIEVEGLFNRYSYVLPIPGAWHEDDQRLVLLYGDNGAGKTTILKCLYHLLSQANRRGHRTALARTPFRRFAVTFANGRGLEAIRDGGSDVGDYRLRITSAPGQFADYELAVNDENAVTLDDNPQLDGLSALSAGLFPFSVHLLRDDRRFESDTVPKAVQIGDKRWIRSPDGTVTPESAVSDDPLDDLVKRAIAWISRQSLAASARGNQGTNTLYTDVLRRIASPSLLDDVQTPSLDEAAQLLASVATTNSKLAALDLVPAIDDASLSTALRTVGETQREEAFLRILTPFLNGLGTRLEALSSLFDAVNGFVDAINSFYVGKAVHLSPQDGLWIDTDHPGDLLEPDQLSSGERQLLLLFLNTMFAHDRPAIFLIDEPELSLNVKWQRRLPDALLRSTHGTGTQFFMATHSFEIMAASEDRVVRLAERSQSGRFVKGTNAQD